MKGKVSYSWERIPHLRYCNAQDLYAYKYPVNSKKEETLLRIKKTHLQKSRLSDLYNYSVVVLG